MAQVTRINSSIFTALLALTFMLSGCGAGNSESTQTAATTETTNPVTQTPAVNSNVRYEGTSLAVFGKYYFRAEKDSTGEFASGQIIAKAKAGMESEFTNALGQVSLDIIRSLAAGGVLVKVPSGFEEQWVRALQDQAFVEYAEVDGIMTIQ